MAKKYWVSAEGVIVDEFTKRGEAMDAAMSLWDEAGANVQVWCSTPTMTKIVALVEEGFVQYAD